MTETKAACFNQRAVEQVIGREGETATLLSRRPLNFGGLGGGFAPRQLNRCALSFALAFREFGGK